VVRGWSFLTLAAACDSHDAHHTGAACLLAIAIIVVGRGCGLMQTLLAPLPTALGALHDILGGNVGQHLLVIARGRVKLGCLIAGGVLGGDTAQLLGGVPQGIDWCMEA
jgi:hypothetical protein